MVTLSIGVTTFDDSDSSVDDVLARADAGSYKAKEHGRDGVVINMPHDDVMELFDQSK